MYAQKKAKEERSQPAANAVSEPLKDGSASLPFPDNRPVRYQYDKMKTLSMQTLPVMRFKVRDSPFVDTPDVVQRKIGNKARVEDYVKSWDGSVWKIDNVSGEGDKVQYKISQVSGKPHLWNPRVVSSDDEGWDGLWLGDDLEDVEVSAMEGLAEIIDQKKVIEMIRQAIEAATLLGEKLKEVMDPDKTGEYGTEMSPQKQLEKCLVACKGLSAQDTAIYLYTTYFYSPLNKFLRGDPKIMGANKAILTLIDIVNKLLIKAFEDTPASVLLPKFRMELQPDWIGKKGVGDELSFPGFTSTHPELNGINSMWSNIEGGAFGKYGDRLALLVFEGKSKFIQPDTKYFRREVEHILPPKTVGKIVKKYETRWPDTPNAKKVWIVDVYHLMILPQSQAPSREEFHFGRDGYIYSVKREELDDHTGMHASATGNDHTTSSSKKGSDTIL